MFVRNWVSNFYIQTSLNALVFDLVLKPGIIKQNVFEGIDFLNAIFFLANTKNMYCFQLYV